MNEMKKNQRQIRWQAILEEQERSGLSQVKFVLNAILN